MEQSYGDNWKSRMEKIVYFRCPANHLFKNPLNSKACEVFEPVIITILASNPTIGRRLEPF
jgi:hypothetical protein